MKIKKLKIFLYSFLALSLFPFFASAHVKWFVNEQSISKTNFNENYFLYLMIWAVIALIIILCGVLLEMYLPKMKRSTVYLINSNKHKAASFFSLFVGMFFITASLKGFLFSPDISNINKLDYLMILIQAIIGLSFVVGASVRTSSIALISLWLLTFVYTGPMETIANIWVLGVGVFTLIYGREYFKISKRKVFLNKHFLKYEDYAIPILRFLVGFDLLFLGISEKILRPELGMIFLETHNWNFMQNFGISWFSNYLFVISAGVVESILGIIFMLGIVTRLNALTVAVFFSIPLFFMDPSELTGHIPHLVMIVLFLIFGSGDKLKIIKYSGKQNT
jgi:uncharacterized membrane protein YphA (DoxX/SURF4 family)